MQGWTRAAGALLLALALFPAGTAARADDYPTRPVRLIVGFAPGAVADIIARAMATRMSQGIGQQIVVENRPGAGSSLGAEYVARAPKDGYTLLMCTVAQTHQSGDQQSQLRLRQGLCADHGDRQCAADPGGASVAAGQHGSGDDRAGEGEPGRPAIRLVGGRHA